MVVAGVVCLLAGVAYFFFTTDLPNGNFKDLRKTGEARGHREVKGTFMRLRIIMVMCCLILGGGWKNNRKNVVIRIVMRLLIGALKN